MTDKFQFQKVRLQDCLRASATWSNVSFNSKRYDYKTSLQMFQISRTRVSIPKGTITSHIALIGVCKSPVFQFQKVRLQANAGRGRAKHHFVSIPKGTITRQNTRLNSPSAAPFQFQKVRLQDFLYNSSRQQMSCFNSKRYDYKAARWSGQTTLKQVSIPKGTITSEASKSRMLTPM